MPAANDRRPLESSIGLICGLARNCGLALEESLIAMRRATSGFREVRVLIVESDSTDETPARLRRLAASGELRAIFLGDLCQDMPRRAERLAYCRNRIVEEVRSEACQDVDF